MVISGELAQNHLCLEIWLSVFDFEVIILLIIAIPMNHTVFTPPPPPLFQELELPYTFFQHFSREFLPKGSCPNFTTRVLLNPTWRQSYCKLLESRVVTRTERQRDLSDDRHPLPSLSLSLSLMRGPRVGIISLAPSLPPPGDVRLLKRRRRQIAVIIYQN